MGVDVEDADVIAAERLSEAIRSSSEIQLDRNFPLEIERHLHDILANS